MHALVGDLAGIGIVTAIALTMMAISDLAKRHTKLPVEWTRKFAHSSLAIVTLSVPLFIHSIQGVAVLMGSMAVLMLVTHATGTLGGIHGAERGVGGVFWYPLAALGLVWFSFHHRHDDWTIFVAGMLVLGFGDAAGAIVGQSIGKHPYRVWADRRRTIEGTAAVFVVSLPMVLVPVLVGTSLAWPMAVVISLTVAWYAACIEAIATGGRDNLLMPLGTMFLLDRLLHATQAQQLWFALAALVISLCVVYVLKISTWPVGGVTVAVLSAYFVDALGGTRWFLPIVGVFAVQLVVIRISEQRKRSVSVVNALLLVPVVLASIRWASTNPHLIHELFVAHVATLAITGGILWYLMPCTSERRPEGSIALLASRIAYGIGGGLIALVFAPSALRSPGQIGVALAIAVPGLVWLIVRGLDQPQRSRLLVMVNGLSAVAMVGVGMAVHG